MDELRTWLDATLTRISGRSELAQAIRYALARWDGLTHVLRDSRVCIDNSAAERVMRPIAIRRRNWTFAGSDAGGARAAIYSLIESVKINGADPADHLGRMLERIADHSVSRVANLLPRNMLELKPRVNQRIARDTHTAAPTGRLLWRRFATRMTDAHTPDSPPSQSPQPSSSG